jgi:hypothetical protein
MKNTIPTIKIKIECKATRPGTGGSDEPRLIFTGPVWDEWDLTFCIHGIKLRWSCDECDDHFAKCRIGWNGVD